VLVKKVGLYLPKSWEPYIQQNMKSVIKNKLNTERSTSNSNTV